MNDTLEDAATAPSRRSGPLLVGGAVTAIALVVASVLLTMVLLATGRHSDDRAAVVAQAEKVAGDLTTIGADNAQQRIDAMLAEATGPFRDQLVGYSAVFQTVLQQGKVGSNGTVSASAVESLGDAEAVVLVAVTSTVTNTEIPNGQQRTYRLAVTEQRVADRWLVSAVDFVG